MNRTKIIATVCFLMVLLPTTFVLAQSLDKLSDQKIIQEMRSRHQYSSKHKLHLRRLSLIFLRECIRLSNISKDIFMKIPEKIKRGNMLCRKLATVI